MNPTSELPDGTQYLRYPLIAVLGILVAVYFHFAQASDETKQLFMSGVFLMAAGMLLWEKRQSLDFRARWGDRLLGVGILVILGWQHQWLNEPLVLRLFPVMAALGVSLMASGLSGLKHYRSELLILFFLGVPNVIGTLFLDTKLLTAAFSTMLLWYAGYTVVRDGVFITLPGGGVEVYGGCSGMEIMTYLLGISIVYLVLFPIRQRRGFLIPIVAIALGFAINGIRVALLAVLSASGQSASFDYWHHGSGSVLFGLLGVVLLGGCYWLLGTGRSHTSPSNAPFPK